MQIVIVIIKKKIKEMMDLFQIFPKTDNVRLNI